MTDGGGTSTPAAAASDRPVRRRRRWLRGLGLGLAVLLAILAGAGTWWWVRGPGPACGLVSRDEIGRVIGHRPGRAAFALSVSPVAPGTTGPGPRHVCARMIGDFSPGLVQEVTVGLTPHGSRSEAERPGLTLGGASTVELDGAQGWRWDVGAMQEVDLLTTRGDRVYVRVTLRSGVPPDAAVHLAELAVRRLNRG